MNTVDPGPDAMVDPRPNPAEVSAGGLLFPALVGAGVAVALGVYGGQHQPSGAALPTLGLSSVLELKAVLASLAGSLALFQLVSALAMWQRLPGRARPAGWLVAAHRWSGTAAFLLSLPVAYHCLWSLGFRDTDARVLAHSLLGCAFYGAFATKLLVLRSNRIPPWCVPVVGGLVLVLLTCIWSTSALWWLNTVGFTGPR